MLEECVFALAGIGIQGGLVQNDWVGLNSLLSCSRTKTASGSSKNDTNCVGSTPTGQKHFFLTVKHWRGNGFEAQKLI